MKTRWKNSLRSDPTYDGLWEGLKHIGGVSVWRDCPERCKSGTVAKWIGTSRQAVHRLAARGKIPGAKRTKGGHFYFSDIPAFRSFVTRKRCLMIARKRKLVIRQKEKWTGGKGQNIPDLEILERVGRAVTALGRYPLSKWHQELREELAKALSPVIDELATYLRDGSKA